MPDLTARDLDAAVCGLMEEKPKETYYGMTSPRGWWMQPLLRWQPQRVSTDLNWAMRAYGVMHGRGWHLNRVYHSRTEIMVELWRAANPLNVARAFVVPDGRDPGVLLAEAICRAIVEAVDAK
jgi:hypothetical protein